MKKYSSILLLFFFVFFFSDVLAQQNLRIYGYVIDEYNRGIENAVVYIESTNVGTNTNVNGYYDINTTITDSITLVYSLIGYETIRQTIYPRQRVLNITVEMKFASKEIRAVNVYGHRRQTSTMDYLDPSKLRNLPNTSGGIESLLITSIGYSSNNELSSQYNVRGGNFDENSVYVNGIEVYRPLLVRSSQQEGLSFINPDMTKNVAFSSGGFEAKYGDKMSSTLDIEYKKPKEFEGSASVGLLGASAYVGTSNKKFTQMHGIRYKTSRYLLGTMDTDAEYQPSFIDYQTFLVYQLSDKWELNFLGNFSQNSYVFIPKSRTTDFGTYQMAQTYGVNFRGWENDLFRTYFGALTLNYTPSADLKLSLLASAYRTDENETYDIEGAYTLSEKKTDPTDQTEGEVLGLGRYHEHARNRLFATVANISHLGEYTIGEHQLKWGLTAQIERISDKISEWKWTDSVGYSLPYNSENFNLYYSLKSKNEMNSFRGMAYLQDTYKWENSVGRWTLIGGVRANYWSLNNELLVSPRASIALIPFWTRDFSFRFATGIYYQAPFYKELRQIIEDEEGNYNVLLNKDIKAQRSFHAVLGGDYYFRAWGRPFKFTTETYLKLADRVISYTLENVNIRYSGVNDARAYTAGIDFKLFGELVPGADTWINFSLMDVKENIIGKTFMYDGESTEWIPRPNSQRYTFSMLFQDYLPTNPKYRLHLKFVWSDGMPFGAPNNEEYRAAFRSRTYRRVDIGASRVFESEKDKLMEKSWLGFAERIWINVEVFNLLNIDNTNSYYWVTNLYDQQMAVPNYLTGRMFNVKLTVDFK